ncbi:albumin-1-like [Vicia villosa]|uniref:albumin-1-like n=1 Tax=Vicia villosa TaxID=3911 RepID=UPI00273CAD46|nr:albumin-1-like [Vicia villosa]
MAYANLAPLAVFMLATFLMFSMKNVEAVDCSGVCSPFETTPCRSTDCRCVPWGLFAGQCIYPTGSELIVKMVEEHPYLCQSHSDCVKKGNGNFCANYPNSEIQYGWCFSSNTEAQHFFTIGSKLAGNDLFNIGSNGKTKDFLKMAAAIST